MIQRPQTGRGLFYNRDSGGRHEMAPSEYVNWARRRATELGVTFDGTPEAIEVMRRDGRTTSGDLFFDDAVKGNVLSRSALDALIGRAMSDSSVTHVFIPRRDRLVRPDDPIDGIQLEERFRTSGVTIVFMDAVLPPLKKGRRPQLEDRIAAYLAYDASGKDRRVLAEKVLFAQIHLAKLGYSVGGRPPYGFRRWLVRDDGTKIRQLQDGERVRMAGHHVVWLPGPEAELRVIKRILEMLERLPASRVAAQLTTEGIPTPDVGRMRTDNGIKHRTSGVWHATTITNIARNPLLLAITTYGRRSLGDQLRIGEVGPRELENADFRPDGPPKVVRNQGSTHITADALFDPLVDRGRHERLLAVLDARGGTQRNKPRSRDPSQNPLGGRVYDMNCGWLMYRVPRGGSFEYRCGSYMQSYGKNCSHNHVDGIAATRVVLSSLQQLILLPPLIAKVELRLRELATREASGAAGAEDLHSKEADLVAAKQELTVIQRNMGRAKTDDQYAALAGEFDDLLERVRRLEDEVTSRKSAAKGRDGIEAEVDAALQALRRLPDLVVDSGNLATAGEAFRLANARLFLAFRGVPTKNRIVNKVQAGIVAIGAAPSPIELYAGPTSRTKLLPVHADRKGGTTSPASPKQIGSGGEGYSLGNRNRSDWTPIELFRASLTDWTAVVRRLLSKDEPRLG